MAKKDPDVLLSAWSSLDVPGLRPEPVHVLPDGCQDLIWMQREGERPVWFIAPLTSAPYTVLQYQPVRYRGYRLQPGTTVDVAALLRAARDRGGEGEAADVLPLLAEHAARPASLVACLEAVAWASDVAAASRALGVSARTLGRVVQQATGQAPVFWRRLARVRRAARQLVADTDPNRPLVELAVDHGYADQAHFSRECRLWLGVTPGELRRRADLRAAVLQSGYGTQPPTGVQTSIRKPEGSAT